jgi:hypothetical protein
MSRQWLVVCALVAMAGCKDKWDKALSDMEGFKDKMCACKDKACVDGVEKDVDAWKTSMKDTFGKEKPPDKVDEKGSALRKEMRECQKKVEKAAGGDKAAAAVQKMTEFKDQMCACKDAACAQKVSDDMTKWGSEQAKLGDKDDMKLDDDAQKKLAEATEQMTKCMTTAMTAAKP